MQINSQADGSGEIEIGGHTSPVSYHVISSPVQAGGGQAEGAQAVRVEISLPRDWLIEKGFSDQAVLIRQNGARITLRSDKQIEVEDAPAILLSFHDSVPEAQLGDRFPELRVH